MTTIRRLPGLDRDLTLWIFAAMGLGIAAGAAFPGIGADGPERPERVECRVEVRK